MSKCQRAGCDDQATKDLRRLGCDLDLADHFARLIDDAHAGLFYGEVQSDIMLHGCASPLMLEAALMRTSFRHQSEAQPPNGPLTAATSPDTPSTCPATQW